MRCSKAITIPAIFIVIAGSLVSNSAFARSITLNLKDADINTLISTVAEVTGKNFIVDPRVKGKVNIISNRPMEQEETYRVFLSILQVHGYSAVPSGKVIKIIPDITAKQSSIPVQKPDDGSSLDEFITQVIPIQNVAAAQLVPILRPLVPQQSHLAAYPPTNVLIVSDRAGNIKRMLDIVRRIDKANSAEVEVIQLEYASASDVARILGLLYKKDQNEPQSAKLTIATDERTNSVLLNGDPAARIKARAIIAHLDTDLGGDSGSTQVVYLKYADAKEMVSVLTGISDNLQTTTRTTTKSRSKSKRKTSSSSGSQIKVNIQAHEATNSLVITAPPKILASLKMVIQQLDIRRAQVMIEAIIVEVSAEKAQDLGVNWVFDAASSNSSEKGFAATSNFGGVLGSILSFTGGNSSSAAAAVPGGFTVGLGNFKSGKTRFGAIISALGSSTGSNILSTPTIMTTDNEAAEIRVAENVPFVTGQYSNTGASSSSVSPFQTIKREDVGLILKVKPQINEGNAIKLDIEQEVSSLSTSAANAVDITTKKRSIKTSIMAEDGQVIILGGLMDDTVEETEQKVPGLGDVPLLGELFKYQKTGKVKRNLMIFLHPVIIRDAATAQAYTHRKYEYIRARQLERREQGTLQMDGEIQTPLLPTYEELTRLPVPFDEIAEAQKASEKKESEK
ncbi:MAG: type II secretion system protein GspD [Gammaproteobacteria bacterium]|nr:MAG: type II secretion system protein GspD [Gammaproteobacteria bacterium]